MLDTFVQYVTQGFMDELLGVVGALLVAFTLAKFKPRAKLVYGRANNSRNVVFTQQTEELAGQQHEVYVEKYYVQNLGKAPATNVEFVLSSQPSDTSIYPPSNIQHNLLAHGEWQTLIPQVSPGELVVLDCLYINQPAAFVASVKSSETVGQGIEFVTQRKFGPIANLAVGTLMFAGCAFFLSLLVQLLV